MTLIRRNFRQYPTDSKRVILRQRFTRRNFLRTTAVTAGGILIADAPELDANSVVYKHLPCHLFASWCSEQLLNLLADFLLTISQFPSGMVDQSIGIPHTNSIEWQSAYIC